MFTRLAVVIAVTGCLTAATAQERPTVALLNGTAVADKAEYYSTKNLARLEGNVVVHLERFGQDGIVADITAAAVSIITGADKSGKMVVQKLFASGPVHIEATTRDELNGETRRMVGDCDRVHYVAAEEVVHLLSDSDQQIVVVVKVERLPNERNKLKQPERYDLQLTARRTLDYRLGEPPAELLGPEAKP
ncbi:MAG: hypothetical protein IT204_05520 [Fimbriimonadaceae bacterium]|nr:hypothetical protein [Fimbriimonadaceae bacterium]